jgi:hypothetical protein
MRAPRERTRLVRRVEKSTAHGVRAEINKRGKVRMSDLRCRSESDPSIRSIHQVATLATSRREGCFPMIGPAPIGTRAVDFGADPGLD